MNIYVKKWLSGGGHFAICTFHFALERSDIFPLDKTEKTVILY